MDRNTRPYEDVTDADLLLRLKIPYRRANQEEDLTEKALLMSRQLISNIHPWHRLLLVTRHKHEVGVIGGTWTDNHIDVTLAYTGTDILNWSLVLTREECTKVIEDSWWYILSTKVET